MNAPLFLCSLQNCGFVAALITLIREKIPLLVRSVISCLITFFVQQHGGAVTSIETLSLKARVANAIVVYTNYIGKMIWPLDPAVLYPLREWHPDLTAMEKHEQYRQT